MSQPLFLPNLWTEVGSIVGSQPRVSSLPPGIVTPVSKEWGVGPLVEPLRNLTSRLPLERGALGCAHTKSWWVGWCPARPLGPDRPSGTREHPVPQLGHCWPRCAGKRGFCGGFLPQPQRQQVQGLLSLLLKIMAGRKEVARPKSWFWRKR